MDPRNAKEIPRSSKREFWFRPRGETVTSVAFFHEFSRIQTRETDGTNQYYVIRVANLANEYSIYTSVHQGILSFWLNNPGNVGFHVSFRFISSLTLSQINNEYLLFYVSSLIRRKVMYIYIYIYKSLAPGLTTSSSSLTFYSPIVLKIKKCVRGREGKKDVRTRAGTS